MKAIEITNLSYSYADGEQALASLQLSIPMGKRTAILGANGSGKTTLIHHLNGIFLAQQGQVRICGQLVQKKNLLDIRKKVGLLFDNPDSQLFSTTVYHDIAFGPRNLGLEEERVNSRVEQAMQAVAIAHLQEKAPYNLSWGQKKRVAIAGILAMQPEIIIFDEPFSGLDPASLQQFMRILEQLYTEGRTLIMSTHDVDIAYAWADEVVILKEGQLLAQGEARLLRERQLMEEASLEVPLLAEIFQGMEHIPRTREAAQQMIQSLLKG